MQSVHWAHSIASLAIAAIPASTNMPASLWVSWLTPNEVVILQGSVFHRKVAYRTNPGEATLFIVYINDMPDVKTSAPNDPKMILNIERSKVPYIHVMTTPKSGIPLCFALRLAISEILAMFHFFPLGTVKFQYHKCTKWLDLPTVSQGKSTLRIWLTLWPKFLSVSVHY